MAQVSLQINGYPYIVGCADGEEAHLRALAAGLDARIEDIKTATGLTGEGRLLVMAALVLSDELHDLRHKIGEGGPEAPQEEKPAPKASRRLKAIAKRAEDIADLADASAEAEYTAPPRVEASPVEVPPGAVPRETPPAEVPRETPPVEVPPGAVPPVEVPLVEVPPGEVPNPVEPPVEIPALVMAAVTAAVEPVPPIRPRTENIAARSEHA